MGNPKIIDRFSNLKVSHQRISQLRNVANGKCMYCGEPLVTANHCLKHAVIIRERQRKYVGSKTRNNSLTYRLSKAGKGAK